MPGAGVDRDHTLYLGSLFLADMVTIAAVLPPAPSPVSTSIPSLSRMGGMTKKEELLEENNKIKDPRKWGQDNAAYSA